MLQTAVRREYVVRLRHQTGIRPMRGIQRISSPTCPAIAAINQDHNAYCGSMRIYCMWGEVTRGRDRRRKLFINQQDSIARPTIQ